MYIVQSAAAILSGEESQSSAAGADKDDMRHGNQNDGRVTLTPRPREDAPAQSGQVTEPTAQFRAIDRADSYDGQLQFYSADNVAFGDRGVQIHTRRERRGAKGYTSGMVESGEAYLYGSFSFVIRIARGRGLFPAIWLLPVENKPLPEIDIFEMIGSDPYRFYGVVHYLDGGRQAREYFSMRVEQKASYRVGLEWTRDKLRWFIDDACVFETDKGVPDEPMYLIVNQAVGGGWAGAPDDMSVFPAVFAIESWTIRPEWSGRR